MIQRLSNPPANLDTTYPYITIFVPKGTSTPYYIYTPRSFDTYSISNNPIDCYIGSNNSEFVKTTFTLFSY